jgi:hypothetical protein
MGNIFSTRSGWGPGAAHLGAALIEVCPRFAHAVGAVYDGLSHLQNRSMCRQPPSTAELKFV